MKKTLIALAVLAASSTAFANGHPAPAQSSFFGSGLQGSGAYATTSKNGVAGTVSGAAAGTVSGASVNKNGGMGGSIGATAAGSASYDNGRNASTGGIAAAGQVGGYSFSGSSKPSRHNSHD